MAEAWTNRSERGYGFLIRAIFWIAYRLGRRFALLLLRATAAYFLIAAPAARRASQDYLQRVLPRRPRWRDSYRQIFTFSTVLLDRLYFLADDDRVRIVPHGVEAFRGCVQQRRGALVMVSHLGSFEALRALGGQRDDVTVRILMNRASGAKLNAALQHFAPDLADNIIDTSQSDVDRVLKVKAALDRGEMVAMMVDRCNEGERTVDCDFLGAEAPFPATPWLLAGMLGAPVFLAFGLYRGAGCYDLHCEQFSSALQVARRQRYQQAGVHAQAYADRLAAHVREAPYNWFNFYYFWH